LKKIEVSHVFFDLDHTLWDFETNSRQTLLELYHHFKLDQLGMPDAEEFISTYVKINHHYWEMYRNHQVSKSRLRYERFSKTFEQLGIPENEMPGQIPDLYLSICPTKGALMPNALQTLEYLHEKYPLHIITNGFKETQLIKLKKSGIDRFFDVIIFSEEVKAHKPNPFIFEVGLRDARAKNHASVFIGDNLEADVLGSRNAGLHPVFYNPLKTEHSETLNHEIVDLIELKEIL
jgi:putative hydrolase of the HAD superfamily